MIIITNGGATNLKVGAQCTGRWGVNTVKTKTFEKGGWWVHDPPPSFYGGATPDYNPCRSGGWVVC